MFQINFTDNCLHDLHEESEGLFLLVHVGNCLHGHCGGLWSVHSTVYIRALYTAALQSVMQFWDKCCV
jgi:hypothetical protein